MTPILSLIDELNTLCELYVSQKEAFELKHRIRQIFTEFVKEGYKILTPQFDPASHEYTILSEFGKLSCNRMMTTIKKKIEASGNGLYEHAADLRDLERNLEKRVAGDFSQAISNRFFMLKSEESKEIIYNDFDGKLKEFFKLT